MFLTEPQSSQFEPARFEGVSLRDNHFDWSLYYRFKDQRERFWRDRIESDPEFRAQAAEHFSAFQQSIDATVRLLEPIAAPSVLDVGLSSEQLDRAILKKTRGQVTVLDIEMEAARSYEQAFGGRGSFILGDVVTFSRDPANADRYDLVYSIGLIEHFPDKTEIVGAHVRLVRPGGLALIYVPADTPANRRSTGLAAEWENFGYRELMTPEELRQVVPHANVAVIRVEAVGLFSAVWVRKQVDSA
jgi:SAM-dependent methyltransferase